jgi:hypothetical protein
LRGSNCLSLYKSPVCQNLSKASKGMQRSSMPCVRRLRYPVNDAMRLFDGGVSPPEAELVSGY